MIDNIYVYIYRYIYTTYIYIYMYIYKTFSARFASPRNLAPHKGPLDALGPGVCNSVVVCLCVDGHFQLRFH